MDVVFDVSSMGRAAVLLPKDRAEGMVLWPRWNYHWEWHLGTETAL